jgi:hypothetical protein
MLGYGKGKDFNLLERCAAFRLILIAIESSYAARGSSRKHCFVASSCHIISTDDNCHSSECGHDILQFAFCSSRCCNTGTTTQELTVSNSNYTALVELDATVSLRVGSTGWHVQTTKIDTLLIRSIHEQ